MSCHNFPIKSSLPVANIGCKCIISLPVVVANIKYDSSSKFETHRSYNRSLSSSPPGQAEAEGGGGGPIPSIEFPDDEVYFYPRGLLLLLLPESSVVFYYKYPGSSSVAPPFINSRY